MSNRRGTVALKLDLDAKGALQSLNQVKNAITDIMKTISTDSKAITKDLNSAKKKLADILSGKTKPESMRLLEKQIKESEASLTKLKSKMDDFLSGKTTPESLQQAKDTIVSTEKEIASLQKKLDSTAKSWRTVASKGKTNIGSVRGQAYEYDGKYYSEANYSKLKSLDRDAERIQNRMNMLNKSMFTAKSIMAEFALNPNTAPEVQTLANQIAETEQKLAQAKAELEKFRLNPETTSEAHYLEAVISNLEHRLKELQEEGDAANDTMQDIATVQAPFKAIGNAISKMTKGLTRLVKRAFYLMVVLKAVRGFRDYMETIIGQSSELSKALGRLKGNAAMAMQTVWTAIEPVLTKIINWIAKIMGYVAAFFSYITGVSLSTAKTAVQAASSAGKAAKATVAGFDELNVLNGEDSDSGIAATPDDVEMTDKMADIFEAIKKIAIGIGLAIASWKLIEYLAAAGRLAEKIGAFGLSLKDIGGIMMVIAGLILLITNYSDAWINGLDWKNFSGIIAGVALVVGGLALLFGSTGAAIGLLVSSIALLILGFKDIIDNGVNLQNTLLVIAGIIAAGLGIALLTGSFIPALVAGIVAAVAAVMAFGGTLGDFATSIKGIFTGIVDFIKKVFAGDFKGALESLKSILKNLLNADLAIVGGVINAIIKGLNWLIGKINTIKFTVPDWVPGIGGKSLGFNLPTVREWSIPYLAQGAVIPPNHEFMAVLGDQKSGTNIEAPLDTLVAAFTEASNSSGVITAINTLIRVVEKKDMSISASDIRKAVSSSSMRLGV